MSIVFLDFEACSLSHNSWPIEVGLAWLVERHIVVESALIRPHSSWDEDEWNPASEKIHGIPRNALDAAEPAESVARWFLAKLGSGQLVSDAPDFDARWLSRLLATIGEPPLDVMDFDSVAWSAFASEGRIAPGRLSRGNKNMAARRVAAHRAGEDARHLAAAFRDGFPTG
jgi:DNA polymerase III epsilon subunit-like protein